MGRVCIRACSLVGCVFHIMWAATLLALSAVLQSDITSKNIGYVPSPYDLTFLWTYDIGLFLTGIIIFCGIVWKRQRLLSWTILFFLFLQSMAFAVVVVMLTTDRFKQMSATHPIPIGTLGVPGPTFYITPSLLISILAGFHCVGTFIYILLLIVCIHKLNNKYSPYWK